MSVPLIILRDILLTFGGRPLFKDLSLSIEEKERACLVGRNGSGKSTLLKILAGLTESDKGERVVRNNARIAYLPQDPQMNPDETITHYVKQGLFQDQIHQEYRIAKILDEMNLKGESLLGALSGGEKRRVALARVFVGDPTLLLLDEPTNHLDIVAIEELEQRLKSFKGAFIAISHDRMFLENLSRVTLWLDRGQVRRLEKGFSAFEEWSEKILMQEEIEEKKLKKLISKETQWSYQGITARRKRNQGRLRRLTTLRQAHSNQLKQPKALQGLEVERGEASSHAVIEAYRISKFFGDRPIIKDFSFRLLRGSRVGIIGPNGSGKTTLLKLLMGEIKVDSGKVRWGMNLTPTYLDQNRIALDPNRTLWETLCDTGTDQIMVRGKPQHVVGYLKDFLFDERQALSPVGVLSGGEKNRLLLAKFLAKESNFLILDEPTNDLDMETLDLLQEVLGDYKGTTLLISHDRSFLDRVVTSTLVFEGEGKVVEYAGGYSDYYRLRPSSTIKEARSPALSYKVNLKRQKDAPVRLSYHQHRLIEILPLEMAALEKEKLCIEKELADQHLFTANLQHFEKLSQRYNKLLKELEEKENQWLELIELRESLSKSD